MLMAGKELTCVDKSGRPLVRGVQVVRDCTIPGRSRATIHCRVNDSQISELGVVEGAHARIQLANSFNRLTERGEVLVQCVNPFSEAVKLPSGSVLGRFHSVQEKDIGPSLGDATEGPQQRPSSRRGTVPPHVQELYQAACDGCASNGERQAMAQLLREYNDVFSSGDHDVGLTRVVRHEIPLAAGTAPIRQPTRRLGPENEVSRQVLVLLDHGLTEPAHSAWGSPVVLVRKKDGSWRFCVDYRKLNSVTIQDTYPLLQIDESLNALVGSKYFSTLDLLSGYWQVPLSSDAQEKAAFIMRAYRSTPHTSTGETLNLLMLGRETRVPDHLTYHIPEQDYSIHEYASELVEKMKVAHEILWEKQWQVRKENSEEPPLYQVGDWVWMVNYRRRRGQVAKLQPKFVGPYVVVEAMPNHTYKLERSGQVSIQNEARLKPYWASPGAAGEAPPRCWSPGGRRRAGGGNMDQNMKWLCRGQKTW